jgi:hypothetical protein
MIPLAPITLRPAEELVRTETVLTLLAVCLRMKADMANNRGLTANR